MIWQRICSTRTLTTQVYRHYNAVCCTHTLIIWCYLQLGPITGLGLNTHYPTSIYRHKPDTQKAKSNHITDRHNGTNSEFGVKKNRLALLIKITPLIQANNDVHTQQCNCHHIVITPSSVICTKTKKNQLFYYITNGQQHDTLIPYIHSLLITPWSRKVMQSLEFVFTCVCVSTSKLGLPLLKKSCAWIFTLPSVAVQSIAMSVSVCP